MSRTDSSTALINCSSQWDAKLQFQMFFSTLPLPFSPSSLSLKEFDALFRQMKSKGKKINFCSPTALFLHRLHKQVIRWDFQYQRKLEAQDILKVNGICAFNSYFWPYFGSHFKGAVTWSCIICGVSGAFFIHLGKIFRYWPLSSLVPVMDLCPTAIGTSLKHWDKRKNSSMNYIVRDKAFKSHSKKSLHLLRSKHSCSYLSKTY